MKVSTQVTYLHFKMNNLRPRRQLPQRTVSWTGQTEATRKPFLVWRNANHPNNYPRLVGDTR